MAKLRMTKQRREILQKMILRGWADDMFMTIQLVAKIDPESVPPKHRRGIDAAQTTVRRGEYSFRRSTTPTRTGRRTSTGRSNPSGRGCEAQRRLV